MKNKDIHALAPTLAEIPINMLTVTASSSRQIVTSSEIQVSIENSGSIPLFSSTNKT